MEDSIVVADIGGTNSRFAIFSPAKAPTGPRGSQSPESRPYQLLESKWLKTASANSFPELLRQLEESNFPLRLSEAAALVIAIAGPVQEQRRSVPPNIAWTVDLDAIEGLPAKRALINDFEAQAFSVLSPVGKNARKLFGDIGEPYATIAVVGAGTGLGKAALLCAPSTPAIVVTSEGGHSGFPFEMEEELALFHFALKKLPTGSYLSYEDLVSGRGLSLIHEFVSGTCLSPAAVAERFNDFPRTLALAARFFGRACRNYVLEIMAQGG
ncbi:MAG: glucokinase, partial [Bdellovibrionales bacterium]|nr:glucokinase [Bdellovibrionales bacterium]